MKLKCFSCGFWEPKSMFRKVEQCRTGYGRTCNDCSDIVAKRSAQKKKHKGVINANTRKRQAAKINRTPKWLSKFDHLKMKCFYQLAAMRSKHSGVEWHVDHIVPLQGKMVSGLHVPWNLQVIPAKDNVAKGNRF